MTPRCPDCKRDQEDCVCLDRDEMLQYIRTLRSAIAAWDRAEPHELQEAEAGLLRALAGTSEVRV